MSNKEKVFELFNKLMVDLESIKATDKEIFYGVLSFLTLTIKLSSEPIQFLYKDAFDALLNIIDTHKEMECEEFFGKLDTLFNEEFKKRNSFYQNLNKIKNGN